MSRTTLILLFVKKSLKVIITKIFFFSKWIQGAMNKFTNAQKEEKLVPKDFKLHSKDGKIFDQKSEEKSTIVTKVTTYQLKILSLMDELVQLLRKPPSITDHIDYFKQRKLFADFIVRFSRNYIYEIDRIVRKMENRALEYP